MTCSLDGKFTLISSFIEPQAKISRSKDTEDLPAEEPHHLFDFLNTTEKHEDGLIEALGSLLTEAQGEDYEELDFANKMKKKRKRNGRQK